MNKNIGPAMGASPKTYNAIILAKIVVTVQAETMTEALENSSDAILKVYGVPNAVCFSVIDQEVIDIDTV